MESVKHLGEELLCNLRARCKTSGFEEIVLCSAQETCDRSFCPEILGLPCCLKCMAA